MARRLRTDQQIDKFIARVIDEAHHHAPIVEDIIQPLSDRVRSMRDFAGDDILEIFERNGQLARTCWVTTTGRRYVFSYYYPDKKIVVKRDTTRGPILFRFDNDTSLADINRAVANLW